MKMGLKKQYRTGIVILAPVVFAGVLYLLWLAYDVLLVPLNLPCMLW